MSKRVDDYKIIQAESTEELEQEVKNFINSSDRYELVGGISTCVIGGIVIYSQAVVKYQE